MSKILYGLGIVWILGIFAWVIRDRKWIGALQCGIILVASGLAMSGDKFGFDGEIAAVIFVGLAIGAFFLIKPLRKRCDSSRK